MIKLPSYRTTAFLSIFSGTIIYGIYDKYELRKIRNQFKEKAQVLAQEPLHPTGYCRKLTIYIAPSHWASYWFKDYVKQILDASAIDYELIQTSHLSELKSKIREKLWIAKESWISPPFVPNYWEWFRGINKTLPPQNSNYHPDEGLVAMGPEAWQELVLGIEQGSLGVKPIPKSSLDDASADSSTTDPIKDEKSKVISDIDELSFDKLPETFPLPIIGYIPAKDQVGWIAFGSRILGYLNQRYTAKQVGEQTLKIAFGNFKQYEPNEVIYEQDNITLEKLDDKLSTRISYYQ